MIETLPTGTRRQPALPIDHLMGLVNSGSIVPGRLATKALLPRMTAPALGADTAAPVSPSV